VSPVKYELSFYIPEDGVLYSHRLENLKSYIECDGLYEGVSSSTATFTVTLSHFLSRQGMPWVARSVCQLSASEDRLSAGLPRVVRCSALSVSVTCHSVPMTVTDHHESMRSSDCHLAYRTCLCFR
jgi:hypothetical protein